MAGSPWPRSSSAWPSSPPSLPADNPGRFRPLTVGQCTVQTANERFQDQEAAELIHDRANNLYGDQFIDDSDSDEDETPPPAPEPISTEAPWNEPGPPPLEHRVPRPQKHRNNLTAMSQRYNLYFAAYDSRIFVYRPRSARILLTPEPDLILATSPSEDIDKRITPSQDHAHPHHSNAIRTGFLGQQEILVIVYDDGAVYAFYTDTIATYIENTTADSAKGKLYAPSIPKPFFKDNAGASTWGLAIHQASRLIAVSTNNKEIVVFAFGLSRRVMPPASLTNVASRYAYRRSRTIRIVLILGPGADNIPNISFMDSPDGTAQKICAIDIRGSLWQLEIWRPLCGAVRYGTLTDTYDTTGWDVLVLPHTSFVSTTGVQDTLGIRESELRAANDKIDITAGLATVPDNPAAADRMPVWNIAAPPANFHQHAHHIFPPVPWPGSALGGQHAAAPLNANAGSAGNAGNPGNAGNTGNAANFGNVSIQTMIDINSSPSSDDDDSWPGPSATQHGHNHPPSVVPDYQTPLANGHSWATLFPPASTHAPLATHYSPAPVSSIPQPPYPPHQMGQPGWLENALHASQAAASHIHPLGLRPILLPRPSAADLDDDEFFRRFYDAYPHDLVYIPHRGAMFGLVADPWERLHFFKRPTERNTFKVPTGSQLDSPMRCAVLRSYNNDIELINPVKDVANIQCRRPVGHPERPGHPMVNCRLNMTLHVPELSLVIIASTLGRVVLITPTRHKGEHKGEAKRVPQAGPPCRLKYGFRIDHVLPRASEERNTKNNLPRRSLLYGIAVAPVPEAPADTAGKGSLLLRRPGSRRKTALGPGTRRFRLVMHYHNHAIVTYDLARDDDGALQVF